MNMKTTFNLNLLPSDILVNLHSLPSIILEVGSSVFLLAVLSVFLLAVLFTIIIMELYADADTGGLETEDHRFKYLTSTNLNWLRQTGKDQDGFYVRLYMQSESNTNLNVYSRIWPARLCMTYPDRDRLLRIAQSAQDSYNLHINGYDILKGKIVNIGSSTSPKSSREFISFLMINEFNAAARAFSQGSRTI